MTRAPLARNVERCRGCLLADVGLLGTMSGLLETMTWPRGPPWRHGQPLGGPAVPAAQPRGVCLPGVEMLSDDGAQLSCRELARSPEGASPRPKPSCDLRPRCSPMKGIKSRWIGTGIMFPLHPFSISNKTLPLLDADAVVVCTPTSPVPRFPQR